MLELSCLQIPPWAGCTGGSLDTVSTAGWLCSPQLDGRLEVEMLLDGTQMVSSPGVETRLGGKQLL